MAADAVLFSYAAGLVLGYLFGSVPFGLLLTRLAGTEDIRAIGSGNIGATNVLRTGRKGLAAATLIADALKGTVAVLASDHLWGHDVALVAGAGAFLGHVFPVWLGFRGGKGVATYIGVLLGLVWPAAIGFGVVWLAVVALSRYSSLAALIATAVTPVVLWALDHVPEAVLFAILTLMTWIMHRSNIERLLHGTEAKIGKRSASSQAAPGP